jgi:DNA-binding response OmpR family regulator
VAVVHDDLTLRRVLCEVLVEVGYQAPAWATAGEAEAALRAAPPAALVLDVHLEQLRAGWELLRRLRADPATAGVPVLIWTQDGAFAREYAAEARAWGADVLPPGIDLDDLLARVGRAVDTVPAASVGRAAAGRA